MKVSFRRIDERTYTVGDTQYWKRGGSYFSWTESGGRKEIGEDEYFKAIADSPNASVLAAKKADRRKVDKPSDYNEAPAEDLALLAQDGDKKAEEVIIKRYTPLVYKISNKYFLTGGDKDDLVQDGLIGMWDAIKTYDESRNKDFTKYIANSINSRLQISIRDDNTGKNAPLNSYSSLDTPAQSDEGEGRTLGDTLDSGRMTPEEEYLGKDGARKLVNFMRTELADKERDVIFRFINGSNIREIADSTGMSYKSVENALMRARNKIREFKALDESKEVLRKGNLRITFRKKINLEESEFTYDGSTYKCSFGRYSKDGDPITKNDYHKARKALMSDDSSKPGSFDYLLSMPSRLKAARIEDFHDFIEDLEYDKSYKVTKDTRDHLPKLSKEDTSKRVSQIMEDTGFNKKDAYKINSLILGYTAPNPTKIIGEDKELLDKYIDSVPVYDSVPLYRGMGFDSSLPEDNDAFDSFKNIEVGDVVDFRGYTSFSSNEDVATNFADANGDLQVFMVNTKNLTGVSIDHLSSTDHYDEMECLYKKEATMKVVKKEIKNGSIYLQVEELSLNEDDINDEDIVTVDLEGSMCLKGKESLNERVHCSNPKDCGDIVQIYVSYPEYYFNDPDKKYSYEELAKIADRKAFSYLPGLRRILGAINQEVSSSGVRYKTPSGQIRYKYLYTYSKE